MQAPREHSAEPAGHPRGRILAIPVDAVGLTGAGALIRRWLSAPAGTLRHIVTVNPEFAIAARRDRRFRAVLWDSALATADGIGIVLAGRILGVPTGGRVTGNDLVATLAEQGDPAPRLFLLGAAPGVAAAAAARLRADHPGIIIAGTHAGSPAPADWPEIAEHLHHTQPDTLLVAFGHPRQDLWIAAHRQELADLGIVIAIGVGGVFDYLAGRVPRAPAWLRRLGLEWLYRLIRQPWRWRRQLALPQFVALVLWERVRRQASPPRSNADGAR